MYYVLEQISKSFLLLNLREGWDGTDSQPINRHLYVKALTFLFNQLSFITYKDIDTKGFKISPCPDGTIELKFKDDNFQLLIKVTKENISWLGDNNPGGDKDEKAVDKMKWQQNDTASNFKLIHWLEEHWK